MINVQYSIQFTNDSKRIWSLILHLPKRLFIMSCMLLEHCDLTPGVGLAWRLHWMFSTWPYAVLLSTFHFVEHILWHNLLSTLCMLANKPGIKLLKTIESVIYLCVCVLLTSYDTNKSCKSTQETFKILLFQMLCILVFQGCYFICIWCC